MSTINPRRRSSIKQALVFAAIAVCSFNVAVHAAPTPRQPAPVFPTPATTVSQQQETRQEFQTGTTTPIPLRTAPQLATFASTRDRRAQVDSVSSADAAAAAAANADVDVQAANLDLGGNGVANVGRVIGAVARGTTGIIGAANGDLSQIPGIIVAVTDGLDAVGDIVEDVNAARQRGQSNAGGDQGQGDQEEEAEAPAAPGAGNSGRNVVDGIGRAARTIGQIGQQ